jgi:hypothetical protein
MTRKSLALAVATVFLLAGGAAGAVLLLVRHEPAFYVQSAVPPGDERVQGSAECVGELAKLVEGVQNGQPWRVRLTEQQLNSYFEEDLLKEFSGEGWLCEHVRSPRVTFEADRIRLGFRYGAGRWSTVVSLELRAWLVETEPNLVAVEFQSLHAGAVPLSPQSLLERVAEAVHQYNIDPTWYRYNGHPVLLLRFQANRSNPTFQLQRLEIGPGTLLVTGRSLESAVPVSQATLPTESEESRQ